MPFTVRVREISFLQIFGTAILGVTICVEGFGAVMTCVVLATAAPAVANTTAAAASARAGLAFGRGGVQVVCTENVVQFDSLTNWASVDGDDRADPPASG